MKDSIAGILFLGTPHNGTPFAVYAAILSQIANIFVVGGQASRLAGSLRTELLKSLRPDSLELLRIGTDFRVHAPGMKIISFIEQVNTRGFNKRVGALSLLGFLVQASSAKSLQIVDGRGGSVGAATERIIPMQGYDHRSMCRHPANGSQGLQLILGAISECANKCV